MNKYPTSFPNSLYRFRASNTDYFQAELQAIAERRIFLTPARFLNDPFDCSPNVVANRLSEITAEIKRLGYSRYRKHRLERAKKSGMYRDHDFRSLKQLLADPVKIARLELEISSDIAKIYRDDDLQVSCFSEAWQSPLMWSHYASSHSGYVVKYRLDASKNRFGKDDLPLKVIYQSERPKLTTIDLMRYADQDFLGDDGDANLRVMDALYYTKASDWSYEQEWRLTGFRRDGVGYRLFRNLVPEAIYFGVRTTDKDKEMIRENTGLLCLQVQASQTSYELQLEEA